MSWFMRGVQSALFHYASCAPCTGYMYRKQRQNQAKKERKAKRKLQLEQPGLYHHPEPSGTNPYWTEEIAMGPGPPPRRARKTNTCNTGASSRQGDATIAGTRSTNMSQGGSSIDVNEDPSRLSEDSLDDENWNRKRYQREDEDLWGFSEPSSPVQPREGSSVGIGGDERPSTSKSSAESYYTVRAPPVNDLHPPVVSLPSPRPSDNKWMLQPPPKASVMSGKERATNRSRSGSGASSRVELSLQRQVSARQLKHKLERGETPEMPPISRGSSYSNFQNMVTGQRHDRPRTPQARPLSVSSFRKKKKRRDTAYTMTFEGNHSVDDSSTDTPARPVSIRRTPTPPQVALVPIVKIVGVRNSHQRLSTVLSSGSGDPLSSPSANLGPALENDFLERPSPAKRRSKYSSTQSSDSVPYLMKHRPPLASSDISSLNVLQDLVSTHALVNSRIVSTPLMEAKVRLPPSSPEEQQVLADKRRSIWTGSGFGMSREWDTDQIDGPARVPFDSLGVPERDPRMRWSVDF